MEENSRGRKDIIISHLYEIKVLGLIAHMSKGILEN